MSIEARIEGDELIVAIENPVDGPPRPRTGRPAVGLDNVRRRLEAGYGRGGQLRVGGDGGPVPRRDPAAGDPRQGERMSGTSALRTIIVDDEPLARQVLREYLAGMPARRGHRRVRQRLRGGEGGRRAGARPRAARRPDAQARWLRGRRADRPRHAGDLRDRVRRVRGARLRGARGRLPAEAGQRRAARRGHRARAPAGAGAAGDAAGRRRCGRRSSERGPAERILVRDGTQGPRHRRRRARLRPGARRLRGRSIRRGRST